MSSDLEKVEARIEEVRAELARLETALARLETAREVVAELLAKPHRAAHSGLNGKGYTIRRVAAAEPAAAVRAAVGQPKRVSREVLRGRVRDALKDGPLASGDLAKRFGFKTKQQKQALYQIMWELKNTGQATKGADERYTLVSAH